VKERCERKVRKRCGIGVKGVRERCYKGERTLPVSIKRGRARRKPLSCLASFGILFTRTSF